MHVVATLVFAGFVVRDILRPRCDPVRSSLGEDDPGGGVLDGAADWFALRRRSGSAEKRSRQDVVVVHGRHAHRPEEATGVLTTDPAGGSDGGESGMRP